MDFTNFSMVKGDTFAFGIEIDGVDTLEAAFFSVKKNKYDNSYAVQKSIGDGIYQVDDGVYGVRVAPDDTKNLDAGFYYYDLQIQVNLDVFTVLIGELEIVEEVTKNE